MNEQLAAGYYRLALASARRRNLSTAVQRVQRALMLDPQSSKARALLGLCTDELYGGCEQAGMKQVRELARLKKWQKAADAARGLSCQSVKLLNIQGCLLAAGGKYKKAEKCFARALQKDRSNRLASACLIELTKRRGVFGGYYEKLLRFIGC